MQIVFTPNTHGVIQICDLLTRNDHKGGQPNKKLKRVDLENFNQFNFEGLAPMAIQNCMNLINDINQLAEKTDLNPTKLSHIDAVFWCTPVLPLQTIYNAQVVMNPTNPCVSTIVSESTFKISEEKIPVPPAPSFSISEIEWNKDTAPPMRVRDIL